MKNLLTRSLPVLIVAALTTVAQPQDKRPDFEVAAIKRCESAIGGGPGGRIDAGGNGGQLPSPGRLNTSCQTVMALINTAYVRFAGARSRGPLTIPISGGPDWINSERYEINAKADGSASREMMSGPMLQALLEDRFRLKIHRETKETAVYALAATKGGPRLSPFKEGSCTPADTAQPSGSRAQDEKPRCGFGGVRMKPPLLILDARRIDLDEFAENVLSILDRPVINQTGIAGLFDFHLEFAPDETTPALPRLAPQDDSGLSIFSALQEQLGLRLAAAKGPGTFLVIDHVEKPSQN